MNVKNEFLVYAVKGVTQECEVHILYLSELKTKKKKKQKKMRKNYINVWYALV